jgi:anti-sigma28 factor (negative regulator of flagellin synthesis)
MQVSNKEIQKVLQGRATIVEEINQILHGIDDPTYPMDPALVAKVVQDVVRMPDREDRIAELKAKIDAGKYKPTGDEIADAMIRRAIADSVR